MSKYRIAIRSALVVAALLLLIGLLIKPTPAENVPQTAPVGANEARFDGARAKIQELILKAQLPSVSVAAALHGKIIWERGFGWADREQLRQATADTLYSLASISKPFTATAIMTLVKQGKLKLDAPANEYLGAAKLTALAVDAKDAAVRRRRSY